MRAALKMEQEKQSIKLNFFHNKKINKMSIGSWIKGWRLDKFFKKLFKGNTEDLEQISAKAVIIVQNIKNYAYNPGVDLAVILIPGDWDKALVEKIRAMLPTIISIVTATNECVQMPTLGEKLGCAVNLVNGKEDTERARFYHDLAVAVGVILGDGKIDISDLFIAVELAFRHIFGKK